MLTEKTKAILGCVAIVACFFLLGFLVHEKADGATTAAIATVTIVVAWVTRAPTKEALTAVPTNAVFALGIAAVVATMTAACGEAKAPRETARAVVLLTAEGVKVADEACASIAKAKRDRSLAEDCADGYVEARDALLVAEDGVDGWDAAADSNLPCAVKAALTALNRIVARIEGAGGHVPPAAADAYKMAGVLTGACRG